MANPEIEPKNGAESGVVRETPTDIEIPEHIERDLGVKPTSSQPKSITDDTGQKVVQAIPSDDKAAISIPADPSFAATWSQGSIDDSSTWLGVFILRKLKQALMMGRKVIIKR